MVYHHVRWKPRGRGGMRDCEKRCMPSRAKAIAEASGKAGWAPGRAARFSWWLEALTREQALAMVSAYYDEVDAGR